MHRSALVLAALAIIACGGDTEPTLSAFAGSYSLTTVAGKPLPTKTTSNLTVTAGSFLLNANGAFQFTESTVEESPAIESGDGICSASSATTMTCRVTEQGAEAFVATLSGNTLSLNEADGVRVYTKS
jgi:hypothetical protein